MALAGALSGCGSTPIQSSSEETAVQQLSAEEVLAQAEQAQGLPDEQRIDVMLDASSALIALQKYDWARNTLSQTNIDNGNETQRFKYQLLSAELAIVDGELEKAEQLLWNPSSEALYPFLEKDQRVHFHQLRARLLFNSSKFPASIDERIILSSLLYGNPEAQEENQALIWSTLMEIPLEELNLLTESANSRTLEGWYTLAALSKNNQKNLQNQIIAVDEWVQYWPEHPASLQLPADLQLLKQIALEKPQNIALLLPLTGKFSKPAQAIRDGFFAGYYHTNQDNIAPPQIKLYDSSDINSITAVYEQAVQDGAEIIVGPLNKANIATLATLEVISVPILALNHIDTKIAEEQPIYQFSLNIEDEARQIAEQAWRDGHRRAMAMAPESRWGDRGVTAFLDRWLELGGFVTHDYRFKNQKDYSTLVKDAVQVTDSQLRAKALRRQLGRSIEFEPRRRQDIDFIFLIGNAAQARQLKPTLAFHYAGDIPVYSVSHIYNGDTNKKLDRDMNNIHFTTLPWFFNSESEEKQAINSFALAGSYQRLYALGVDAFYIHPRLKQLNQVKNARFYGTTGTLNIDQDKVITRKQIWAQYKNGIAQKHSTTSNNDI